SPDPFADNGDAFVAKLSANGASLVYSTYLGSGRTDEARAIAVASNGQAVVTGSTRANDYPTTAGAYDTTFNSTSTFDDPDVFVTRLNAAGTGLVYSTFLGGTAGDIGYGVALDAAGAAYVTGNT